MRLVTPIILLMAILTQLSWTNPTVKSSNQVLTPPQDSTLFTDSTSATQAQQATLDSIQQRLSLTSDSLERAKVFLDSFAKVYEANERAFQELKGQDSVHLAQLDSQKVILDSLSHQNQDQAIESKQWKQRFLWQLPLTIGLFLLGFGMGGGHFP